MQTPAARTTLAAGSLGKILVDREKERPEGSVERRTRGTSEVLRGEWYPPRSTPLAELDQVISLREGIFFNSLKRACSDRGNFTSIRLRTHTVLGQQPRRPCSRPTARRDLHLRRLGPHDPGQGPASQRDDRSLTTAPSASVRSRGPTARRRSSRRTRSRAGPTAAPRAARPPATLLAEAGRELHRPQRQPHPGPPRLVRAWARSARATDALGNVTTYDLNSNGLPDVTIDPLNRITQYTYDSQGNMTDDHLSRRTNDQYTYNSDSEPLTHTDGNGTRPRTPTMPTATTRSSRTR